MAADKHVIVLTFNADDGSYDFLMWADVPAARQSFYANASATSQYLSISQAELNQIQSGAVVETRDSYAPAPGASVAQIEADLQAKWTAYQAQINSFNPWTHYGSYLDSSGVWHIQTVS